MKDIGYVREKGRLLIRVANLLFPDTAKVVGKAQDAFALRPMMEEVAKQEKQHLIGAEIGVDQGRHVYNILKNLSIKKLYLIDPYEYPSGHDDDHFRKEGFERRNDALYLLRNYRNVEWVKRSSNNAVDYVPSDLDFVYIDGDHRYDAVHDDCENWYPKVRIGGIMGGHDYISSRPEVKQAVLDFCRTYKLKLETKPNDWWIIKEREL